MLARLAENLFWAGRYMERAEDTARMIDVTYHTLLESPPAEEQDVWEQLLEVLHLELMYSQRYDVVRPTPVTRFLFSDQANPGSVMAGIAQARENLRSVRELLPSELWEGMNRLHLELAARDVVSELDRPYDLCATVKRGVQTIAGVAAETMPRDDGYRFLMLGRMLERAEMTCRLVAVRHGALADGDHPSSFHHWVAILKSVSAAEAFRRTYRASTEPRDVVEFLLLDPDCPRSVLHCLQRAEAQLSRLAAAGGPGRARRAIGRIRSQVEFTNADELLVEGLAGFLDDVQAGVAAVANAAAEEYFRHVPAGSLHTVASI